MSRHFFKILFYQIILKLQGNQKQFIFFDNSFGKS